MVRCPSDPQRAQIAAPRLVGADTKRAAQARTKKAGIVGKYGTRYGASLRKQARL